MHTQPARSAHPLLSPTKHRPTKKNKKTQSQTAVEAYGAFVNVGARSDGLVHVSQLADGYVRNVADVVAVGAQVKVKVMSVDAGTGRLALTMKGVEGNPKPAASPAGGAAGARGGAGGGGRGQRGGQRSGGARGASSSADAEADAADELEANEAFAAQAIAVNKDMGWNTDIVNVNGGAIALGHPIGASVARVFVSLLHEMQRRNAKKGLATLCIGGGMGIALCVER